MKETNTIPHTFARTTMAFYMTPKKAVDVDNIDYDNYIQDISQGKWGVLGPISLAGGGSINLGTFNSKSAALECIKGHLDMLIKERKDPKLRFSRAKKVNEQAISSGLPPAAQTSEMDVPVPLGFVSVAELRKLYPTPTIYSG